MDLLWALGIAATVIIGLISILWGIQQKRIKTMEMTIKEMSASTIIVAHIAEYQTTVKAWTQWREGNQREMNEHSALLQSHTEAIARMAGRLNGQR